MNSDLSALVPVAADVDDDRFELLDLAGATYREAFFGDTVRRVRDARPDQPRVYVRRDEFLRLGRCHQRPADVFIFHLGRCGSTLLANMLAASDEFVSLKEPDLVNDLLSARLRAETSLARDETEGLLTAAIPFLVGTVRHSSAGPYRALKFAAWNVSLGALLMAQSSTTPVIFLYRSPIETVASLLANPPAWFDLIHCPRTLQKRFFPSLGQVSECSAVSPVTIFSHAWASAVDAALALPVTRVHMVEYSRLVRDPLSTLEQVLKHIGYAPAPRLVAQMVAVSAVYSKDPEQQATYDPAAVHWRRPLTPAQETEVWGVVGDRWKRLNAYAAF